MLALDVCDCSVDPVTLHQHGAMDVLFFSASISCELKPQIGKAPWSAPSQVYNCLLPAPSPLKLGWLLPSHVETPTSPPQLASASAIPFLLRSAKKKLE